jgi:hypothetical protein
MSGVRAQIPSVMLVGLSQNKPGDTPHASGVNTAKFAHFLRALCLFPSVSPEYFLSS